jgi:hypothetical protein
MPGAQRTRSLVRRKGSGAHKQVVTTGSPKRSGTPCAMVLRLLRALLGVPGLLAPVVQRNLFRETCPQRRGDRTTRLDRTRLWRTSCGTAASIASRATFRDDREAPL